VRAVQFEAVHNFNLQSREAVYDFLAKLNPGWSDGRELKEQNIEVPMLQEMLVLSDRTLPPGALDLSGLFKEWRAMASRQNGEMLDAKFLRERLRQTLGVENPPSMIAETNGQSIVLSRSAWADRVPGIWIDGKGEPVIVIDPDGAEAALNGQVVAHLRKLRRPLLLLDVFQTGAAKTPRDRADHPPIPVENAKDESQIENEIDDSPGPKFLTYNLSDDAARVQDILTAIGYLHTDSPRIEIDASGDAALWATFAVAISPVAVDLHTRDAATMSSDEDYLKHFNVPGILRAGGFPAAQYLVQEHAIPRQY
jgi:hypothetical protein